MKGLMSRRPSPALVVAIVALVVAMFGTAYAATQLPKNSVGTKQLKANAVTKAKIKKNAITTAKIKKNAVTGAKVKDHSLTGNDINLDKLGTVPLANVANTANALAPMEATHQVGAPGEPAFLDGSSNPPSEEGFSFVPVGFYKDHDGVVHLEGVGLAGESGSPPGLLFQLPSGFRPAAGKTQIFASEAGPVFIFGSGVTISGFSLDGDVYAPEGVAFLSGISFRAES
jgi:hypothetical protein